MSIGRSRARLFRRERTSVTFDDVAGAEEAKGELKEIIGFLRDPDHLSSPGGRVPKGILLVGPPATRGPQGMYPEGTVNGAAQQRLLELAREEYMPSSGAGRPCCTPTAPSDRSAVS